MVEQHSNKLFWIAYLITTVLVVFKGPELSVPFWDIGNDDAMRLVQVRDMLNGQGWFDLMQYRMGADGGTFMHWSRLVDLPIAALIWIFSIAMSSEVAEAVTMVVWPILLIGPTLWAMYIASIRFGGESAGIFGLIFTTIAIVVSEKFNPGSLDHHNVQMMLVAFALMAMMSVENNVRNGAIAGAACAASMTIGLETMLFVAAASLSVALIWIWKGHEAQRRTLGFASSFVITLVSIFIVTRPDLSPAVFQCDAFGIDLLLIGGLGAGGLAALVLALNPYSWRIRILGIITLGAAVLLFAMLYAPACLANPFDQLYPEVASEWLSRIVETKSLLASVQSDGSGNFGLLIIPVIAVCYTFILSRKAARRPQALVLLMAILTAYAMTFYQLRGLFFLLLLCTIPIAAMLGKLYAHYRTVRTPVSGIIVIAVLLVSLPDLWSLAYINVRTVPQFQGDNALVVTSGLTNMENCHRPEGFQGLSKLPTGLIASSTDMGAVLMMNTEHSVLSSNFHRNQDGIQAGIDLSKADLISTHEILLDLGIDYVVFCKDDHLPLLVSAGNTDGLWPSLYAGDIPEFLSPTYDNPTSIVTYKVLK